MTMGTGGLNVEKLRGLLERRKISLELLDGDAARDGCRLKISSLRAPNYEGLIEYENQGEEPRLVGVCIVEAGSDLNSIHRLKWDTSIELRGARNQDPMKIAKWIEQVYLGA